MNYLKTLHNQTLYDYDTANRPATVTNSPDATNIGFGYDIADRLTGRTYPNGVNTTYEYDGMSRLTRLKDANATATMFDRQYSYNAANQISQIAEPDRLRMFGYDNVDRITSATDSQYGNESYAYDAVGNRTSSHRSATYGYQPNNRLTSAGSVTYEYDANGVLGSMYGPGYGSGSYGWDYENRLSSMINQSLDIVTNTYDALGRRVSENMSSWIHSDDNFNYTYDGQDVLREDRLGSITTYQNGQGIDNKLSLSNYSGTQYFIQDHLGSTTGLADANGDLGGRISYDSFGNVPGGIYD